MKTRCFGHMGPTTTLDLLADVFILTYLGQALQPLLELTDRLLYQGKPDCKPLYSGANSAHGPIHLAISSSCLRAGPQPYLHRGNARLQMEDPVSK
jgi:hypothetical protein